VRQSSTNKLIDVSITAKLVEHALDIFTLNGGTLRPKTHSADA
jgi:hypothetical protein